MPTTPNSFLVFSSFFGVLASCTSYYVTITVQAAVTDRVGVVVVVAPAVGVAASIL